MHLYNHVEQVRSLLFPHWHAHRVLPPCSALWKPDVYAAQYSLLVALMLPNSDLGTRVVGPRRGAIWKMARTRLNPLADDYVNPAKAPMRMMNTRRMIALIGSRFETSSRHQKRANSACARCIKICVLSTYQALAKWSDRGQATRDFQNLTEGHNQEPAA